MFEKSAKIMLFSEEKNMSGPVQTNPATSDVLIASHLVITFRTYESDITEWNLYWPSYGGWQRGDERCAICLIEDGNPTQIIINFG